MLGKIKKKINKQFKDKSFEEVLRGSLMVFSSRIFETIFTMATSIFVARIYGAEVVGVLAVVRSLMEILIIFCLMGTDISLLRLIPQHREISMKSSRAIYLKVLSLVLMTALILSVCLTFAAPVIADKVFNKPYMAPFFFYAAYFILPKTLFKLNLEALRGLKQFKSVAIQNISLAVTNLCALLVFTVLFLNKYIPIYSYWTTMVIVGLISSFLVYRSFRGKVQEDMKTRLMSYKELFTISAPMFATKSAFLILGYADIWMLTAMLDDGEKQAGFYQVAWKLIMFNKFFKNSITSTAAPKLSELHTADNKTELRYVAKKTTQLLSFTVLPFIVMMVLFGRTILTTLYGAEFIAGYLALVFLGVAQMITAVLGHVGMFLNMCGKQKEYMRVVLFSAMMNVGLNYLLIPEYGIAGAAFANVLSVLFTHLVGTWMIRRNFGFTIAYLPGQTLKK